MKKRAVKPILHIVEADVIGPSLLRLVFDDGTRKCVDVKPLLWGPMFEPLLDPSYFARVQLDPQMGTVCWPNEADFAPEALYDLPDIGEFKPQPAAAPRPGSA
jgi:hypothetical protein